MKLSNILKKVGKSVLTSVIPGGELVLNIVNEFLPAKKKLDKTATGADIEKVIDSLPPDQKNKLLEKELDVKITEIQEWTKVVDTLANADAAGSSTRPIIAKWMAQAVCFAVIVFVSVWAVSILRDQVDTIKQLQDSWPLMLTVLATPTALLRAYFGMRTKEKKVRYESVSGQQGKNDLITNIMSIFKK